MGKPKVQARSSRAADATTFGQGFGNPAVFGDSFAKTTSSLSYLAQPPDPSGIADANVVVLFKLLSKRESITKQKALEELQNITDVEDAILDVWVEVYPRTSIDTSKRVRQLAHIVHGKICLAVGKRIAKHMPIVIGPWLLGLYDTDKSVSLAAQTALSNVFNTPEKVKNLRKAYQGQILDFCNTIIENETPQTLSDERAVSADEAIAKYNRVIAAALGLLASLFTALNTDDREKLASTYTNITSDKKLWALVTSDDPYIRRGIHRLLKASLEAEDITLTLDPKLLSAAYIEKGLESSQSGSALLFTETLVSLSKSFPGIWTDQWVGKKLPHVRLRHFLRKGSQAAPVGYWPILSTLIDSIAPTVWPVMVEEVEQLLKAFQQGITQKEEPRTHLLTSIKVFFHFADVLCSQLSPADRTTLLTNITAPIVQGFIFGLVDSPWSFTPQQGPEVLSMILEVPDLPAILASSWSNLTEQLIEMMKLAMPEQSSGYEESQNKISATASRYAVVLRLLSKQTSDIDVIRSSVVNLLRTAFEVCTTRNGKPYGVAKVIEHLLHHCGSLLWQSLECSKLIDTFISSDLPGLFTSPSYEALASILTSARERSVFKEAWQSCLTAITFMSNRNKKLASFIELLKISQAAQSGQELQKSPEIERIIEDFKVEACWPNNGWNGMASIMSHLLVEDYKMSILSTLAENLYVSPNGAEKSLEGIELFGKTSNKALKSFLQTANGKEMVVQVLRLTELEDEVVSDAAKSVNTLLYSMHSPAAAEVIQESGNGLINVIKSGLESATSDSLNIITLIDQAINLLEAGTPVSNLLPDLDVWHSELSKFTNHAPAVTNGLIWSVPAVLFAIKPSAEADADDSTTARDASSYSIPLRMAFYVTELLDTHIQKTNRKNLDDYEAKYLGRLLTLLSITVILVNENATIAGSNKLWFIHDLYDKIIFHSLVEQARSLIIYLQQLATEMRKNEQIAVEDNFLDIAVKTVWHASAGSSASAYYNSLAYQELLPYDWELQKSGEEANKDLMDLRKSKELFQTIAYLMTSTQTVSGVPIASRWFNELIADLTGFDFSVKPDLGLHRLCLLNSFLLLQDGALISTAAPQRLLFLFRSLVDSLLSKSSAWTIQIPIMNAIVRLVPSLLTVYEDHWETLVGYIKNLWLAMDQLCDDKLDHPNLLLLHSSLRLYQALKKVSGEEECNEDLVEALTASQSELQRGLLNLLLLECKVPEDRNSFQQVINEIVIRELGDVDVKLLPEPESMFHLLHSSSISIQHKIYEILHKQLPQRQEKLSLDLALEQAIVRIPDELLSLILDAPPVVNIDNIDFHDQNIIVSIRSYLLSWVLLFDHFQNASHQLKNQYLNSLKEGGYIPPLLTYIFDILGHSKGKPITMSPKIDVTNYRSNSVDDNLDYEYNSKDDIQALLAHIYYLCLLHVSSPTKAWWMEHKSRAVVQNVEKWTARYISPHIHAAVLEEAQEWAEQPKSIDDEGKSLTIKANPRVGELTASYDLGNEDEQRKVSILVTLPPNFPLDSAKVSSLSVTTFSAQQWQAWLRVTQHLMAFSNNNIVDGIVAWRRNIVGALQGKSECTICYSLVSEDGKLPDKKCSTCKNAFHMLCLTKWFSSGGDRKCPLCRSAFTGLGRGMGRAATREV